MQTNSNETTSRKKRPSDARPVSEPAGELKSPGSHQERLNRLLWNQESNRKRNAELDKHLNQIESFLAISNNVTVALDQLSEQLFRQVLDVLEERLTRALDEVLGQTIKFRSDVKTKHGAASVHFYIDHDGNEEDIQKGQGGSVQNILSVGLRFFALAALDESEHRRFVVLDEQDCWLQPEVVPKLVKIIDDVVRELGFQIIVISHHDSSLFERYADKIYRFEPVRNDAGASTVEVVEIETNALIMTNAPIDADG